MQGLEDAIPESYATLMSTETASLIYSHLTYETQVTYKKYTNMFKRVGDVIADGALPRSKL